MSLELDQLILSSVLRCFNRTSRNREGAIKIINNPTIKNYLQSEAGNHVAQEIWKASFFGNRADIKFLESYIGLNAGLDFTTGVGNNILHCFASRSYTNLLNAAYKVIETEYLKCLLSDRNDDGNIPLHVAQIQAYNKKISRYKSKTIPTIKIYITNMEYEMMSIMHELGLKISITDKYPSTCLEGISFDDKVNVIQKHIRILDQISSSAKNENQNQHLQSFKLKRKTNPHTLQHYENNIGKVFKDKNGFTYTFI